MVIKNICHSIIYRVLGRLLINFNPLLNTNYMMRTVVSNMIYYITHVR